LKKAHEKIKELRKPGPDQLKPKKRENSISQGKGILVQHWKREVLPQVYKGLCHLVDCGQIILDSRPGPLNKKELSEYFAKIGPKGGKATGKSKVRDDSDYYYLPEYVVNLVQL